MKKIPLFLAMLFAGAAIYAQTERATLSNIEQNNTKSFVHNIPTKSSRSISNILHYDSDNIIRKYAIGNLGDDTYKEATGLYICLPEISLDGLSNKKLLSVMVQLDSISKLDSTEILVYNDITKAPIYKKRFEPVSGWNNVKLDTPIDIPEKGPLYVGYKLFIHGSMFQNRSVITTQQADGTNGTPNSCLVHQVRSGIGQMGPYSEDNWFTFQKFNQLYLSFCIKAVVGEEDATTVYCSANEWNAMNVSLDSSYTSNNFMIINSGNTPLNITSISGISAPFTTSLTNTTIPVGQTKGFNFAFKPQATNEFNQNVIINTSGGNLNIQLKGKGVPNVDTVKTFPWTEGFEGVFPPAYWSVFGLDGESGTGDGYDWEKLELHRRNGEYAASSRAFIFGAMENNIELKPNNFLVSPPIKIDSDSLELRYWVSAWNQVFQTEHYKVLLSTTGNLATNFTTMLKEETLSAKDTVFTLRTILLKNYKDKTIYIAFNHLPDSYSMISIDDVSIAKIDRADAVCTPLTWTVTKPETKTFTIKNVGRGNLTSKNIKGLSAPFSTDFDSTKVNLQNNQSYDFTITFNPSSQVHVDQVATIETNGGIINIDLTGYISKLPIIECNRKYWDIVANFGESKSSKIFTISNVGADTLKIDKIALRAPFSSTIDINTLKLAFGQTYDFNLKFAPQAGDTTLREITDTIISNGGNLLFRLNGFIADCPAISTFPWYQTFNEQKLPSCWLVTDANQDFMTWMPMKRVDENINKTFYGMGSISVKFNGMTSVASMPDDYLITPLIDVNSDNLYLKFFEIVDNNYPDEEYEILVSKNGTDPADFDPTPIFAINGIANDFLPTDREVSLNSLKGQKVHFAFHHITKTDQNTLLIGNVKVETATGIEELEKQISIYPNPSKDFFRVLIPETAMMSIKDITGRKVYAAIVKNGESISTSNFNSGVYIVSFNFNGTISNTKLILE